LHPRRCQIRERAVAGRLDDAAMVGGNRGVGQLAAMGLQRRQRAHFIGAHQPAVADDIDSENGRKPALGWLSFHVRLRRHSITSGGGIVHRLRSVGNQSLGRPNTARETCAAPGNQRLDVSPRRPPPRLDLVRRADWRRLNLWRLALENLPRRPLRRTASSSD